MKFKFNIKNKEASFEADVEGLVEKKMDFNAKAPVKKTKYQIKQEEMRKTEEMKNKQKMKEIYICLGILAFCAIVIIIGVILEH